MSPLNTFLVGHINFKTANVCISGATVEKAELEAEEVMGLGNLLLSNDFRILPF